MTKINLHSLKRKKNKGKSNTVNEGDTLTQKKQAKRKGNEKKTKKERNWFERKCVN